ncbi:autotransporter domain-containing protein [Bosea lupini]|nr:autotransporter domain-containing protein [Bosea lupini]
MTAGSIEGTGTVLLGSKQLTVGSNNLSTTFSGTIIDSEGSFYTGGSLVKVGSGTLTLTGANSYTGGTTVSGGTLAGTTTSLQGAIQVDAALVFDQSNTGTYAGALSGAGSVTKRGSGAVTFTGSSSFTGQTSVEAGTLSVNGSLAGSTVVVNGGTLGGTGTVGGITAVSGTVAPGNSIGTLTVAGNVSFASGSTYQVEVNAAGQSDRIVASGSATLSGGTVQVLAESGNYAASTSYTILTASGGVSGSFTSVTSNLAFLTPSLSYGGANVTLTMTRNDAAFGPDGSGRNPIAQTRNQGFIAIAAERLGVGNAVYDALISATADQARAGFDLLSGEAHAQAVSVMIDESRLVRDTILGHLRGPLLTAPGQQVAASFSADLPGRKGAIVMPAPLPQPRYALWGTAFGGTGNSDGDGNAASLSRRSGGALLGADLMVYDAPGSSLKLGVAGGYSQSRFDLDARLSSGKLESGHAALYAGARFGNLRFDAGAAYTWSESDIRRQVQIRGLSDLLRLQRPGQVAQGFAELGYAFAFSGVALEPFAQLALIRVSTDAGTERGGAAALRVLSSDQTLGFTTLGVRAEAQLGAMPLFARAMLGWRHGFGDLTPQARTAFVAGTTPTTVFAAPIDREALVAEAGLDWRISQATALGLTYSAAIGERSRDHALKGRVELRF